MDKAADYILHGGTELDRAQAECEVTANHLGIALEEAHQLRLALAPFVKAWDWAVSDGKAAHLSIGQVAHLAACQLTAADYQRAKRALPQIV